MNQPESPRLRGFLGKKLLSFLRNGDYAHAGEIDAILMTMSKYSKDPERKILDAGCGLGGTADFIQKNGWGNVAGIDIDEEAIIYAKNHYKDNDFYCADVTNVFEMFQEIKFDLICLFNSFYAFHHQNLALNALSGIANENAKLVIFDYSDKPLNSKVTLHKNIEIKLDSFMPVKINEIELMLSSSSWQLSELVDVSNQYITWYSNLLDRISHHKEWIISQYGMSLYLKAQNTYQTLYQALLEKSLGGIIVYAEKIN